MVVPQTIDVINPSTPSTKIKNVTKKYLQTLTLQFFLNQGIRDISQAVIVRKYIHLTSRYIKKGGIFSILFGCWQRT